MSCEKREQRREEVNGEYDGNREKSSTETVRTVTEEEVDEFFKIIRRVHVATRTVTKINGDVDEPSKKRKRSQGRNSIDINDVRDGELDEMNRVGLRNSGLDLNCKPEPEPVSS
ncbi:unnamed protein product [Cochlearia groenlandica]